MKQQEAGKTHSTKATFGKVFVDIMHNLNITDGAVRLYSHMHWRYGANQDNHEGQESMAKILGVTRKTIRSRIDELEAHDWVMTIYQKHDQKKTWQRCFYHVFESQDECRTFRQEYKPITGETVEDKPEIKARKSRKGAGNKAPINNRVNSASHDSRVNSTSHGTVNSSSQDLDSVIQTQKEKDSAPTAAGDSTQIPKSEDTAPIKEPVPTTPDDNTITHRQKTDLIKAWWEALPESNRPIRPKPPAVYQIKAYIEDAEEAIRRGITPDKMVYYVKGVTYQGQYWHTRVLRFTKACEDASGWLAKHYRPPSTTDDTYEEVRLEDLPTPAREAIESLIDKWSGGHAKSKSAST